jgi:hypothetical protein
MLPEDERLSCTGNDALCKNLPEQKWASTGMSIFPERKTE